ncbi:MAG TPA: GNAT family N-acetyltransferase [Bacteroidia bacterium]
MNIDLQPHLQNEFVRIQALKPDDFEILYAVANDPLLWEQHPNRDRYKREVFENFFKGAIESKGAFLVFDNKTNKVIGSSRFYDLDVEKSCIAIGYTFISRDHWGSTYNHALKGLMVDHAFTFVNTVVFHIGAVNVRSQRAIEKFGAKKIGEIEMEYYGEPEKLNFIYAIEKSNQ